MFWIFFLLIGMILIAVAAVLVVPRLVLFARTADHTPRDRGVRKVNTPHGSVIVYEPDPAYRGALFQFALARSGEFVSVEGKLAKDASRRGERVTFAGKWAKNVYCAEYALYIYDSRGKILALKTVREFPKAGVGQRFELPCDTGSVSPVLLSINGGKENLLPLGKRSLLMAGALVGFLTALQVCAALLFEIGFSHLFSEEAFYLPGGTFAFLGIALVLSAATCAVAVFVLFGGKRLFSKLFSGRRVSRFRALGIVRLGKRALFALFNAYAILKTSKCALAVRRFFRAARERLTKLFAARRKEGV